MENDQQFSAGEIRDAIRHIRDLLKTYINENGIKALVIGISGGIDSATCAALARPVCDELGIPLIGRSLPTFLNKNCETDNASVVGNAFCTDFKEVNIVHITGLMMAFIEQEESGSFGENCVPMEKNEKIRRGNVIARTRMIYLYNLAHLHGGMVLSTDNLTELLLSFFTIAGDIGDFGMIQGVFKTEVYTISRYLVGEFTTNGENDKARALDACIGCTVTDGLGVSNSSLEQLGAASYDDVDDILIRHVVMNDPSVLDHPIIVRHERYRFKRDNPHNIPRSKIFPGDTTFDDTKLL